MLVTAILCGNRSSKNMPLLLQWFSFVWLIYGLFNDTVSSSDCSVEWQDDKWMMNWKGYGRKRLWLNFRYCPGICLEGLSETTRIPNKYSQSPGRDLNLGSPEYEVGVLTTRSRCLTFGCFLLWTVKQHGGRRKSKFTFLFRGNG
jgi:hypothetical protein